MVYECNYLNKIPTHSLNHLSSFQCRKSLLALASLGWNEMHRRRRGEWNSIYVKLFFAKFNAPKMVGCLLAKCWRLGGQLIRIQFHKYISPHYILLNPMLFYTNYLWVSPFYFACHLSFLSLFQTTILKIASVWVWMCVCVCICPWFLHHVTRHSLRTTGFQDGCLYFFQTIPLSPKENSPQFITLLAPKMGKKERSTTQIFFCWIERKRKEILCEGGP